MSQAKAETMSHQQQPPIQRFRAISKAVYGQNYSDLGETDITEDSTLDVVKIKVTPHEGVHANSEYTITIKFQEEGSWPLVYVDSELFDKIKTRQYFQNRGAAGAHKGICIKNLGYGYAFTKNFRELCGNKWENYVYYLINLFNNLQDFKKGNGFKSNYKQILGIP
jgi:hypothetical protein